MNNYNNCNANVNTQGCFGDPRFFRITLEGNGCGCGTNSNSNSGTGTSENGSLLINSNHFFATTEERDAYFVDYPAELQEGILISVADKFYMLINGDWVEKTAVVQGSRGEQGIQGEAGQSAYDIAVKNGYVGTEQEWLDNMTTINTATFDEWVSEKIKQSLMLTDTEAAMQKAALQWAKAELGVEYWTGKYHVDGKKIYGKKIDFGPLPNNTSKSVLHGITNGYEWVETWGIVYKKGSLASGGHLPYAPSPMATNDNSVALWLDSANILIAAGIGANTLNAIVTLMYTCTDR